MSEYVRPIGLILVMVFVGLTVGVISIYILYRTTLAEEREHMLSTLESQARLIEAVARFDASWSEDYPEGAVQATLSQVADAHERYGGFGDRHHY